MIPVIPSDSRVIPSDSRGIPSADYRVIRPRIRLYSSVILTAKILVCFGCLSTQSIEGELNK